MRLIQPIKERKAFFNGWGTSAATYRFACPHCGSEENVMFNEILEAAWGWKERTPKQEREEIAEVFDIDLSDDYIGHGMNAVVESLCSKGRGSTYIYFWFHEYRNSCYDISLRASAIKTTEQVGGHDSGGCAPSA